MLDNLLFSLKIVAPIFLYLAIGMLFKKLKLLPEGFIKIANKFVFNVLFPCKIFYNIYMTDIIDMDLSYVLAGVIAVNVLFILLMIIVPKVVKQQNQKGVIIQAINRGNFNAFCIPLAESIYGTVGGAYAAILGGVAIPFQNIHGVIALAPFSSEKKVTTKEVIIKIITNAQVIACIIGIIVSLTKLNLPTIVIEPIRRVQNITTPFSIFVIGAAIDINKLKFDVKKVAIVSLIRLVVVPLITVPVFVLLGFRDGALVALSMMFSVPVAASSVANAYMFNGDSDLANEIVLFTSLICVFTIAILLFILKSFMLL